MGWVEGVKMGTDWYNERMAKERQDRVDAQNKQLFDLKMEEANRAKLERQQLSDASKPAVISIQDAAVDLGNGQKVYNMPRGIDGADVAATDARQARMMTERDTGQGAPAPQVTPAKYTMNGKAFADPGSMQAAATEYDSPQALAARQAAVLNSQGNPMGAMQLANAAVDSNLKGYQLSDAETAQANTKFNTHVDEVIARSPDKWTGLAAIGTETQVGPMKDVKVRVQSDGANMRFVATMPDGTEKPGAVYPNTDEGFTKARYDLMKLDPATKSKILDEQVKTERKDKVDQADINYKKAHADYLTSMAEVAGRKVDVTSDKLSEIDKIELVAINKQKEKINEAMIKAQAEGTYDPTTPGASSLVTQLAALTLKERQITQKYGTSTAQADPLGVRKPANATEAQLKVQATGDMGADPKALQREIDKTTADITKVTDQSSKDALLAHLADLKRQQTNISAPVAKTPTKAPTPSTAKAPAVTMQGTLSKPDWYVGIDKVSPSRGKQGGYTFNGQTYPTEQAALVAYYSSKR